MRKFEMRKLVIRKLSWTLYSGGSEVEGWTADLTVNFRSWLIGTHVSRWQFLNGSTAERTIHAHLGPLCLSIWKELT